MYSALVGWLLPCTACSVVGLRWQAGVSCACVPSMVSCLSRGLGDVYKRQDLVSVTKRRSSWACRGNPEPEQETIKGTHAQETSAYQRRPTTQHAVQGSSPLIRALYMQLAKIPHTHQTTPRATSAARADQHGTHRGRNRYHCLLYTSPSPRDRQKSRMPSSA